MMQAFWLQIADPNKVEMCAADPSIMVATTIPTRVTPDYVTVKEYEYYCNGAHTGTLYLKEPVMCLVVPGHRFEDWMAR